ncbi:multidrug resistance protein fnx1 [Truncatella angustata]|uniref:Multidrug resistance protein fnx1 n=1 Tax=Truncatella angustata TaxID=152316 RepID=A0A9P8ULA4_9PEZI|nr:multidrug resistance protein fnx1 [Truncatella angustata]KAH6654640.1 multidrug resistance protein fnx1 [Truncatella angustata]
MDQTLVIATYGKIGSDLKALNNTSWIATSYFLTLTTFQPLYGKLSDIFGRKECLLFAYTVFGLGCLGCGLSQDITQLCVSRAVAGMGGGGMNAVVSILMTDLVSLRDRGVWQGYINVVFAAGIASGAPLGGLMADSIGWRWAFIGQFPIAIIAWSAVFFVLDLPKTDHSHWIEKFKRIDFPGAITLSAAVFLLAFGLDNGSNEGWSTTETIVPLALTPVLLVGFILIENKIASHPFAPGHVILDPPVLAAYGANFFGVAAQMGSWFFVALFYQGALGLTASQSGLMFLPGTVTGLIGSLGGGFVMKRTGKYYWLTLAGYAIVLLSLVLIALFSGVVEKSLVGVLVAMVLLAFGASISITTTLIAVISNTAPEDMAVAVACSYLFRSLGTTIGISISTAVLQQVLRTELAVRLSDSRADEIAERVRESLDYIRELPIDVANVVRDCYATATSWACLPVIIMIILCLISSAFIREKKLER